MQFFMTYEPLEGQPNEPPTPEKMAAIGKFTEEMMAAGIVVSTGGMAPLSSGGKVKSVGGKFSVIDGPYAEAKEVMIGWAIVEVKSRDEAIEMARQFMAVAGDGQGEIRQLMMGGPPPQ